MAEDNQSILIVEADRELGELYSLVLRDEGYRTEQIAASPEAIDVTREKRPDLVILDIPVVGSHQYDLLDALRADEAARRVPVLVITTSPSAAEASIASYNVRGAITKPFDLEELLVKTRDALKQPTIHAEVPSDVQPHGLLARAEKILAGHSRDALFRWVQRLRQESPWREKDDLRLSDVLDSVPVLVEALAGAMQYGDPGTFFTHHPSANDRVRNHAAVRRGQGISLGALVREYGILRDELWQMFWQYLPEHISKDDGAQLQKAVDGTLDHIVQVTIPAYLEDQG